MLTTYRSQTTNDVLEEKRRRAEGERAPDGTERERLQVLVGELLSENQRLRFENERLRTTAAGLEQQAEKAEHGLRDAAKWAGTLW